MSEWRSIDSAPRDGTPILLYLDPPLLTNDVIGWAPMHSLRVVVGWANDTFRGKVEWNCGFCEDGTADTEGYSMAFMIGVQAVAWQPLPEPPQ